MKWRILNFSCLLKPGAVARSVASPLGIPIKSAIVFSTCFGGKLFLSSADSRKASFPFLAKEWALNTDKLPPGGLPVK